MKRSVLQIICLTLILSIFALPELTRAQTEGSDDDGLLEALQEFFQRDYMSFGVLLQSQGEFHWEPVRAGENTFRIPTARLKVQGELDNGFGYVLQTSFTGSPSLLDVNMSYAFSDDLIVTTGAMKPGLSAEFLTSAASTDFINRSRIVSALVQRRDIGVLARANIVPGVLVYGGMFNGTNQNLSNSNNTFYYTGRLATESKFGESGMLQIGLNAGFSEENATFIGDGSLPPIIGNRTVYGGDVRLEVNRFMVSSEVLGADLDYAPGITDTVFGFHVTGGYWATDNMQLVLRYDHIESEQIVFVSDIILGGINYNFTDAASFQLNYEVNPNNAEFGTHRLLAQMQIAF